MNLREGRFYCYNSLRKEDGAQLIGLGVYNIGYMGLF